LVPALDFSAPWNVPLPLPSSTLTLFAGAVGSDQVGLAVTVDVGLSHGDRHTGDGAAPARLEGAVAVAQQQVGSTAS
jgi:hypothetical protein